MRSDVKHRAAIVGVYGKPLAPQVNEHADVRSRALCAAIAWSEVADIGREDPAYPAVGFERVAAEISEADVCPVATDASVKIVGARL
jgi:hypothetical protein